MGSMTRQIRRKLKRDLNPSTPKEKQFEPKDESKPYNSFWNRLFRKQVLASM